MSSRGWEHVTASDIAQKQAKGTPEKPSKYRNVKIMIDGRSFDSKREASVYAELKLREKAGEVRDLLCQVTFPLYAPLRGDGYHNAQVPVADYIADFVFDECVDGEWRRVVADVKGGKVTQIYALKKKWLELQSGIQIREIR